MSSDMCRYSRYHSSDTCRIHHHNHATSNVVTIYASMLSTHPTLSSNHSTPCTHRHRTSLFMYHTITLNPSTPRCIRLIPHQRHPIPTLPVNTSTITTPDCNNAYIRTYTMHVSFSCMSVTRIPHRISRVTTTAPTIHNTPQSQITCTAMA